MLINILRSSNTAVAKQNGHIAHWTGFDVNADEDEDEEVEVIRDKMIAVTSRHIYRTDVAMQIARVSIYSFTTNVRRR